MEFETLEPLILAVHRHHGAHKPDSTTDTWEQLILWASPRGLLGRDFSIRGVGLLWDDPRFIHEDDRRYDVAVPIDIEDVPDIDMPAFVLITMPGEYLKLRHTGPYDRILDSYNSALGTSLRAQNLSLIASPIIEIYRNSPSEVSEDDLETDIYFPVIRL